MRGLLVTLFVLSVNCANAASFECSKTKSLVEEAVCSNADLSSIDDALSRLYHIALERVTNKEQLKAEQRQWLGKRNACDYSNISDSFERSFKQKDCLQYLYRARLQELGTVAYSQKDMGIHRCSSLTNDEGRNFVITNGVITEFTAATSVSDPDFALGYTFTCMQHIGNFYQVSGGKEAVLQFFPAKDQFGESTDCQVHIEDLGSKFRVRTSNCQSECMAFDYEVAKSECY